MTTGTNPSDNPSAQCDRRGFFRAVLRLCALGGLAGGGYALLRQSDRLLGQTCVSDGICARCDALEDCGTPQALSLKQVRLGASGSRRDGRP